MGKVTMMTMGRRSSLLAFIATLAFNIVEGKVVPRPTASVTAAAKAAAVRRVELPRNHLPDDGTEEGSLSSSSIADDILPTPPRHLILDGTPSATDTSDGTLLHALHHEELITTYDGSILSSSVEFTLHNHRSDGRFAIISGLGINVQIVTSDDGDDTTGASTEASPCRVKMYTKRNGVDTDNIIMGSTTAEAAMYELAVDAKILCLGQGQETLLTSDLFVRNKHYLNLGNRKLEGELGGNTEVTVTGAPAYNATNATRAELGENTENIEQGNTIGAAAHNATDASSTAANPGAAYGSYGLSQEEEGFPLLIPPDETLSVHIFVMSVEGETAIGTSFLLLSSEGSAASPTEWGTTEEAADEGDEPEVGALFTSDSSLNLYTGSSIVNGYAVNPDSPSEGGTVDEEKILSVTSATVFNGAVYYDIINPHITSLEDYYDELAYSLLPGDSLHGLPGCDKEFSTGYIDTVGSYGVMFDVTSNVPSEDGPRDDSDDFVKRFKNVEIYGLDLYIRNFVNTSFEVYVRTAPTPDDDDVDVATSEKRQQYTSYAVAAGQTLISKNWERIAKGIVEGRGPDIGSPIPHDAWQKNIVIPPGETAGFYVTVQDGPHLRYRNTTIPEGNIYQSDEVLNVAVGRSWGEYPLRGDGTDVYFSPREFAGAFHYHVHEGLCLSESPSEAPSFSLDTDAPSISSAPTESVKHSYAKYIEEEGLCPEEDSLETTFEDGTGSFGGLFDVLAKKDVTLTGIDLNVDWNTGHSAHVLIYARQGSWFGHQNNAASWPYLIVNTTLDRPLNFHNRSMEGPYIQIGTKRNSAIVPSKAFTPLVMKTGETWSLYVCTSLADFRYTLGTSIGKTFAANSELQIMEGAGAADYPPFKGGNPMNGGAEYTFYAPRVFNGNLRYDYTLECPSGAPSSVYSTPTPTVTPMLTTTVSFTFYVEHSPEKLKGVVTNDMSVGVRDVMDQFLGGKEDILYGHAKNDGLVIERVMANMVSPTEIGYLCYPTPPETCTPISVDVTATHSNTVSTDEIAFAFLRQSMHLPTLINVPGYTIEYVGDRAVETNTEINLSGVPDREMLDVEREYFENVARDFLDKIATVEDENGNDILRILSVTVNGQEITNVGSSAIENNDESTSSVSARINNSGGRRLERGNNVQVSVRGKYRPPPEVDFGELVESSINRDRELLQKELKKDPPKVQDNGDGDGAQDNGDSDDYFRDAEVVGAREIKGEKGDMEKKLGGVVIQGNDDDGLNDILNLAAMVVGGLILVLSLAFILRPHRRRAIFGSSDDTHVRRSTQPVDADEVDLLKKSRGMVRGWPSEGLTDSGNSFLGASGVGSDQAAFDPSSSETFSNFSSGHHMPPGFNPHESQTSHRSNGDSRRSFSRGNMNPSLNGSGTAYNQPVNGSFTRGGGSPNDMRPYAPVSNRGQHPPPSRHLPHNNSMPPNRPGGPPPQGMANHRPTNHSMPPQQQSQRGRSMRSGMQSSMQSGQSSMQSGMQSSMQSGMQSSMQSGPPSTRVIHNNGMGGSARRLTGGEGGRPPMQVQDPRERNPSMRGPEHPNQYGYH